jgi:hypothetical protein
VKKKPTIPPLLFRQQHQQQQQEQEDQTFPYHYSEHPHQWHCRAKQAWFVPQIVPATAYDLHSISTEGSSIEKNYKAGDKITPIIQPPTPPSAAM